MALLLALLLALIFAAARAGGLGGAYYEARGAWLPLAAGSTQPLPVADRKRGAAGAEEAQRALAARGRCAGAEALGWARAAGAFRAEPGDCEPDENAAADGRVQRTWMPRRFVHYSTPWAAMRTEARARRHRGCCWWATRSRTSCSRRGRHG